MNARDSIHRQFLYAMVLWFLCFAPANGRAQEHGGDTPPSQEPTLKDSVHQLQVQIQQLQAVVKEIKEFHSFADKCPYGCFTKPH